ncbi:M48 family metallopeptidase [Sinosporangium siamense]|uniref:Zn-dependent protease n=1 Tax=Sinosporangium siamense TaxID=1367973 RepID=A0A919RFT6_9ACTN|nr:M48 family metallopeptidase [Sinosporangium siamense]GII91619.1 Zn-dependent protease [Sinosporangium siamense]
MTVALRAVLAITLLSGFYLLVATLVGAALFFDLSLIFGFGLRSLQGAVGYTLAAGALIHALWVVSRRKQAEEPGIEVSREQEPELWHTVEDLARQVQTAPPDEIRLVAEVNAAVAEDTRLLGLRAVRRRMYIGVPLMLALTRDQMRAVLGHELGHYSGAHTRLGAPIYRGRVALIAAVRGLSDFAIVRMVFSGYARLYLLVSQAVSRRQELEADRFAVAIAGREAMAGALRTIHVTALAWEVFTDRYLSMAGAGGRRPRDVMAGFQALLHDPERRSRLVEAARVPEKTSRYDSHPALHDRLAMLADLPDPGLRPDPRPALSLLRDPGRAIRAVEDHMWSPQALTELKAVSWEELVASGMYAVRNAEALHDLAVAGQRVRGTALPYLDTAFQALADGQRAALEEQLLELGWHESDTLLTGVLAQALEAVLIRHGQAKWTLSWSGPARLLFDTGEEVAVVEFAAQIVDDPSGVPGMREWLRWMGVPPDYVPS